MSKAKVPGRGRGRPKQTECKRGHSYEDPANVLLLRNGYRACRICMREAQRVWAAKNYVSKKKTRLPPDGDQIL